MLALGIWPLDLLPELFRTYVNKYVWLVAAHSNGFATLPLPCILSDSLHMLMSRNYWSHFMWWGCISCVPFRYLVFLYLLWTYLLCLWIPHYYGNLIDAPYPGRKAASTINSIVLYLQWPFIICFSCKLALKNMHDLCIFLVLCSIAMLVTKRIQQSKFVYRQF